MPISTVKTCRFDVFLMGVAVIVTESLASYATQGLDTSNVQFYHLALSVPDFTEQINADDW